MKSNFLSLNLSDIWKGLLMAILTPVVVIVQQSLEAGIFTFDWKSIILSAIGGGVAYLVKNFFTKPEAQGIIGGSTPPPNKDEK